MAIVAGLNDTLRYGQYTGTYDRAEYPAAAALTAESMTVSMIVHGDFSYVAKSLTTLFENAHMPLTVYVTINQGDTASIKRLQREFPQVRYVINDQPRGFAYNHNHVMHLARTDIVALLNDDITITSGMIDQLITFMADHPNVGLATPRIVGSDGESQLTAFNDPTVLRMLYRISGLGHFTRHGGWVRRMMTRMGLAQRLNVASLGEYPETRFVPVVAGVAMFARRAAYEQAGLMDEATLVYGEESAWHWRIRRSGWQVAVVGEAVVVHHNATQDFDDWKLAEHRKGILNYFIRYRPMWQAALIRLGIIGFHSVRALVMLAVDSNQSRAERQTVRMALTWSPARTGH